MGSVPSIVEPPVFVFFQSLSSLVLALRIFWFENVRAEPATDCQSAEFVLH